MSLTPVFLYDFSIDTRPILSGQADGHIYLYGYLQDGRQLITRLYGYEICFDVAIDLAVFRVDDGKHTLVDSSEATANSMIQHLKNIRVQRGKQCESLEGIFKYRLIKASHFKGMRQQGKYSHIRLSFDGFQDYENVKRILSQFNEQYMNYVHGLAKAARQQSKDPLSSMEYEDLVTCEPYVKGLNSDIIEGLAAKNENYSQRCPFRMSEDDPANRYIFKIQRHSKVLLCDWNAVRLPELKSIGNRFIADIHLNDITQEEIAPHIRTAVPLKVMSWDIEVSTKSGKFDDNGMEPENRIICICYTVGDPCSLKAPIKSVCIVTEGCESARLKGEQGEDIEIVTAETELQMILEFAKHIHDVNPAFITGFNDSAFDWPFLKQRLEFFGGAHIQIVPNDIANQQSTNEEQPAAGNDKMQKRPDPCTVKFAGILSSAGSIRYPCASSSKQVFATNEVKINAGNNRKGVSLNIPGVICVDTRTLLMRDQSLEKRALNDYLSANNLPLKLEVDFDVMNRAYRGLLYARLTETELRSDLRSQYTKDILHIYEYCSYDADACRLLWAKRSILRQVMEVSRLSYTPIRNGFLNASGMKVRNMVAAFANAQGYSVPMASTSNDVRLRDKQLLDVFKKYPGAYVPEPHKGVSLTPVIALDFASLYPSIIMTHNLSPESVIEDDDVIAELSNPPTAAGEVLVLTKLRKEPILCSRVEVEFEDAVRGIKRVLKSYVVARSENLGVYPRILANLFQMRKEVKGQLAVIENSIKQKEQEGDDVAVNELRFQYSLADVRQRAIKVFMNTFYGETGNQLSSLFDVVISGGTTSYGQNYIKHVHRVIAEKDCEVVAGDTDSIYFRPRASHYSQELMQSFSSTRMLSEGMQIAFKLQKEINAMVGNRTHGILKMEFEEMLCPSIFTGKKKYFGVVYKPEHSDSIDLLERVVIKRDALVKGIDFIKSQYPPIIKNAGYSLLEDLLNHFTDHLRNYKDDSYSVFMDEARQKQSLQIVRKCTEHTVQLLNRLKQLTPEDYSCASLKKKVRDTKSGEMQKFKARFTDDENTDNIFAISIAEVKELNIAVPQTGELLDIVYIIPESFSNQPCKASNKMHLLEFAQRTKLELNVEEYINLFRTSVSRIALCHFLPPNIDRVEQALFKKIQSESMSLVKSHFSIANIIKDNAADVIITPQEVRFDIECSQLKGIVTYIQDIVCRALREVLSQIDTKHFKFGDEVPPSLSHLGFARFSHLQRHLEELYPIELMMLIARDDQVPSLLDASIRGKTVVKILKRLVTPELIHLIKTVTIGELEVYFIAWLKNQTQFKTSKTPTAKQFESMVTKWLTSKPKKTRKSQ